jgi:hypothetical protein
MCCYFFIQLNLEHMKMAFTFSLLVLVGCAKKPPHVINSIEMASIGKHLTLKGLHFSSHPRIKLDLSKKNGLHEEVVRDTITGYQFYVNGLKHGPYFHQFGVAFKKIESIRYPADGLYFKGKKHGQFNVYNKRHFVNEIVCFQTGDTLWKSAYAPGWKMFPYRYLITPFKKDELVELNYPSGEPWYNGKYKNYKPVGTHSILRRDGSTVATIDYNNWTLNRYTVQGEKTGPFIIKNSWSIYIGR